MSHARGATDGPKIRSAAPPAAFLERLLAHINPHHPPPDRALLDAQRACARWCALRRLRLSLPGERFADMVGVTVEQLHWLETGIAKPDDIPADARLRLSRFLRSQDEESAWVAKVVAVACGQPEALSAAVVEPVLEELTMIDTPTKRDRELAQELVAPESPEPQDVVVNLSVFEQAPIIFEVLRVLFEGESYLYAIWEKVRKQTSVSIAELGELLDQMCASNLLEQTAARFDPNLDDEELPFYQIAATGRRAFQDEHIRRVQQSAEKDPLLTPERKGQMGLT